MSKKVLLSGNTLTIILNGNVYTNTNATAQDYHQALTIDDEDEIRRIMCPELYAEEQKMKKEKEYVDGVKSGFEVLVATGGFEVKDDAVYMKGINRSMPELLIKKFVSIVHNFNSWREGGDSLMDVPEYVALKRFWKKCCLCPNAQSAEDLYRFLEKHNMKITKNGNFLAYRRVVSRSDDNKALVEFVANQYTKLRARHKATAVFNVWQDVDDMNNIILTLTHLKPSDEDRNWELMGNLKQLYLDLPALQAKGYTDNHTKTFDYRIGEISSMPRDEGNDDNKVSCSKGLHAASKEYDYSSFGDTDILVIISPHQVLAVPQNEDGKLRTSAFYFACTLSYDERYILDQEDFDVTELDDHFEEKLMFNLEEEVKNGFAEEVKRHTFSLPATSGQELTNIVMDLKGLRDIVKERVSYFETDYDEFYED